MEDRRIIRIPAITLAKIRETRKITNPFEAVVSYIELVNDFNKTEIGTPTRFSEQTGIPVDWYCKGLERFAQKEDKNGFLFNNELSAWTKTESEVGLSGTRLDIIHPEVVSQVEIAIQEMGPLSVKIGSKSYVAYLDSIAYSPEEGAFKARSGIVVMPMTNELKLEGLVEFKH